MSPGSTALATIRPSPAMPPNSSMPSWRQAPRPEAPLHFVLSSLRHVSSPTSFAGSHMHSLDARVQRQQTSFPAARSGSPRQSRGKMGTEIPQENDTGAEGWPDVHDLVARPVP